ncbi:hypothetical protein L1049_017625 [Liquidambar formosana]|uniref:RRM domain-containing protein n=1 Tax=Liquidambar formosana TaxID=63359 RepID=A0AAP0S265_LIQFO
MGRYRSRSRSYSPPAGRKRYDEPRDNNRDGDRRRSPASSGLLVRNISLDARPEDLRTPFERFGPVRDVYLPKNYYTREPRGFGFVKFRYAEDAAQAKQQLNHTVIGGREIRIVFAEENRKTPRDMRMNSRTSGRFGGSYRRRTPPRSPRRRYRSYSRSPSRSPARRDSRDHRERDDRSPPRSRSISRSLSPRDERDYRSNKRSLSPRETGRSPHAKRDHASRRSRSLREDSQSPLSSRSRSYGPR